MSGWPQISVAVWLCISFAGSLTAVVRPRRGWIALSERQQRIAAAAFAAAAAMEGILLTLGGFWK